MMIAFCWHRNTYVTKTNNLNKTIIWEQDSSSYSLC